jgi:hypothetical protein
MAEATLEERVATLEQLVAQLIHTSGRTARKKEWRRTIGMFDGDPVIQAIMACRGGTIESLVQKMWLL